MTEDGKKEAFYAGWQAARARDQSEESPSRHSAYLAWSANYEPEGVDPLALMLDGAALWPNEPDARFGSSNVATLEVPSAGSAMRCQVEKPEVAEVAQAIFELEAWADWQPVDGKLSDWPMSLGTLAHSALAVSMRLLGRRPPCDTTDYLEAAARLRDGWRPQ